MYFYFQFTTIDPDTPGDAGGLGRSPSIKNTYREAILEQPPLKPQNVKVTQVLC
jgi:hypothetical protein